MNCLFFHKWSKWSKEFNGKSHYTSLSTNITSEVNEIYQQKICLRCNKIKMREI